MSSLTTLIDSIPASKRHDWDIDGDKIRVATRGGERGQTVHISTVDEMYVLTSVVLGTPAVTKSHKRWRRLALLAWQRNAEHQLVTFAFDRHDRLVGRIEHPAKYLDPPELELYVNALARECDRFEYLLSGKDEY